ncbi:hypothetical protein BU16DRAFT_534279 [Lophium mytilinum]|uniref:Uncharacterized protein n=1 Tax=Lophium mytilinum TaxID=390894 RepID=A0A6A6RA34_9PEZI|nr:hypothetical protein BU16DRAFT_534279 [Lophium mytilinum]
MATDPRPPAYQSRPPSESNSTIIPIEVPINELPPSYADATQSETAPLLSGPPPTYGTHERVYPSPPASVHSSATSSAHEAGIRSLPEWVGQALVVLCFLGILYAFWRVIEEEGEEPFTTERWKG